MPESSANAQLENLRPRAWILDRILAVRPAFDRGGELAEPELRPLLFHHGEPDGFDELIEPARGRSLGARRGIEGRFANRGVEEIVERHPRRPAGAPDCGGDLIARAGKAVDEHISPRARSKTVACLVTGGPNGLSHMASDLGFYGK
jgi:hypothetical protein